MLLGTKVPWSVSPEKRGGPWAPPPRCVLLKAVLFCVWHLVRDPASCLGNVKRFVALGLLSSFGCPLSFGPVRSVFSPLFSLSLVRLLSANVALSLSLSLSLRCWGNANHVRFAFPLVFLLPGRGLLPRPVLRPHHLHQGSAFLGKFSGVNFLF